MTLPARSRFLKAGASALAVCALFAGLLGGRLAKAETVELEFYYPIAVGGPIPAIIDDYVARFHEEHPEIRVNPIYAGTYNDTVTKAITAIEAGDSPQVAVLLVAELHTLVDGGYVTPISALPGAEADWLESFYPAFLMNSRAEGEIWSVPFQRSTAVLYYNREAFAEAGLDPEQPPRTWAEMVAQAEALLQRDAAGNVTRWGVSIPSSGAQWMYGALTNQAGHRLMNEAGDEVWFDAPGAIEPLQLWYDLAHVHGVMPAGIIDWGALPAEFMAGRTAMMWQTTGNLTRLRNEAPFDFGVAHLPGKDGPASVVGGGNLYIFADISEAEKQAALTFVKWLTQPELAADWSIRTGYVATSPEAYETEALRAYVADFPLAAVARDQLDISTGELSTHENQRIYRIINDAVESVLTGGRSAEEALAEAQRLADRTLAAYR